MLTARENHYGYENSIGWCRCAIFVTPIPWMAIPSVMRSSKMVRVVGRIMSLHKDVWESVNMLVHMTNGTLQIWLNEAPWGEEIILDYACGSSLMTWVCEAAGPFPAGIRGREGSLRRTQCSAAGSKTEGIMCKDWRESNLEVEKDMDEFLHNLGIRKDFLPMTQNLDAIEQNINKSIMRQRKIKPKSKWHWEKIHVAYITGKKQNG